MTNTRWSCGRIVADLRELEAAGVEMSLKELRSLSGPLYYASVRYFGSLDAALKAAGLERVRHRRRWTPKAIIGEIRAMRSRGEDLGHVRVQAARPDLVAAGAYRFGTWERAVAAAGIDYAGVRKRRALDGDNTLLWLLRHMDSGLPLTAEVVEEADPSVYKAARRYYGSFYQAVDAALDRRRRAEAGLPLGGVPVTRARGRRAAAMTGDEVLRELRALRDRGEDVRATTIQRADKRLYNATRRHFGSVRAAFNALDEKRGSPEGEDS